MKKQLQLYPKQDLRDKSFSHSPVGLADITPLKLLPTLHGLDSYFCTPQESENGMMEVVL